MELFRRWGSARTVLTWRRGRRVRARLWAVGKDADVQADVQVDVQALYKCLRAFTRDWRMHKLRAHGGRAAQGGWEGYQPNFARRANNIKFIRNSDMAGARRKDLNKCPLWPLTPRLFPPIQTIRPKTKAPGKSFVQSARDAHAHRDGRPFPPGKWPRECSGGDSVLQISGRTGRPGRLGRILPELRAAGQVSILSMSGALTPLPPITIQNQALGIICPVGAGAHAHRERPFPPASGPGNAGGGAPPDFCAGGNGPDLGE